MDYQRPVSSLEDWSKDLHQRLRTFRLGSNRRLGATHRSPEPSSERTETDESFFIPVVAGEAFQLSFLPKELLLMESWTERDTSRGHQESTLVQEDLREHT